MSKITGYFFYAFLFLINTWGVATAFADKDWLSVIFCFSAIILLIWRREGVIKAYGDKS